MLKPSVFSADPSCRAPMPVLCLWLPLSVLRKRSAHVRFWRLDPDLDARHRTVTELHLYPLRISFKESCSQWLLGDGGSAFSGMWPLRGYSRNTVSQ